MAHTEPACHTLVLAAATEDGCLRAPGVVHLLLFGDLPIICSQAMYLGLGTHRLGPGCHLVQV